MDLGFEGPRYTWRNHRDPHGLVFEWIDMAIGNVPFFNLFKEATLFHSPRTRFGHCPILMNLTPSDYIPRQRPFRFEVAWLNQP